MRCICGGLLEILLAEPRETIYRCRRNVCKKMYVFKEIEILTEVKL